MKDFSNASFPPETLTVMKGALDRRSLHCRSGQFRHVQSLAETILRTAKMAREIQHVAANGTDGASDLAASVTRLDTQPTHLACS